MLNPFYQASPFERFRTFQRVKISKADSFYTHFLTYYLKEDFTMKSEMKQLSTAPHPQSGISYSLSRFYRGATCKVLLTFSILGLMLMIFFGCGEGKTPVEEVDDNSQTQAMQDALLVSSVQVANNVKSAETAVAVDKYLTAQDARTASDVMKPVRLAPAAPAGDGEAEEADDDEASLIAIVNVKLNLDGSVTLTKSDGSTVTVKLNLLNGSLTVKNTNGQDAHVIIKGDAVEVIDAQGTAVVTFQNKNRAQVTFESGQTFTIDASQGRKLRVTTDTGITVQVKVPKRGKVVIQDSTNLETEVNAQADGVFQVSHPSPNAQTQVVTIVTLSGQGRTEVKGHGKGHGSEKASVKATVENKGGSKAVVRHEDKAESEIEIEVEDEDTVKVKVEGEAKAKITIEVRPGGTFEVHHEDGTTTQVEAHADGTFTVTTQEGAKIKVNL